MVLWGRISGAPHGLLALSLLLLLLLAIPNATAESEQVSVLVDHGGEMLHGNLDLSIVFYGQFGRIQKNALRAFLKSLNQKAPGGAEPSVSSWWHMVSSYTQNDKDIDVRVVQQYVDPNYAHGKVMTRDFIKILVEKALVGFPHAVPVIVAARDVTVEGLCIGRCSEHGDIDGKPYVILGNPETECPGACAWPFHKADYGPPGPVLKPPSGDVGADAMVISLASGLASVVSNPFRTGLFLLGHKGTVIEATTACPGMFGTGATPRHTGKLFVDIRTGGAYNAIGFKGKKFLLPALWNPKTQSCWTVM
ncbi:protein EXORDIUM-like 2 [Cucurbita pepo subsp. pepo]|uniref:protein EXORDIUM-like 2 n=1 Tax=Cucurbita pepo subsp. pepo TaxID=3664 RepID=UPI000C9D38CB|nr:protein EXORDIUM-like 2 [Cucurbita pepo subsp. pepo]